MFKSKKFWVISAIFIISILAIVALAQQQKPPADLNDFWKGKDVGPLVDRLEAEDREIYQQRATLAALVGPPPGAIIADVGAGSGFMSEEFAKLVGPSGKVYAVDINPYMLDRIAERARSAGVKNIETITCPEDSTNLPPNSVDIVFICDTYHHFQYPAQTMASVRQALRPEGQLIVVEFNRDENSSDEWLLSHVRAGREVFQREIENEGFELTNLHNLPALAENYILRFRVKK